MITKGPGVRSEAVEGISFRQMASSVKSYIELTKPRSVFLLAFTSIVMMFLAIGIYDVGSTTLTWAIIAIVLACSGTNAVSCYVDRDLDSIMERTKHRPIPSGRINPPVKALYWGMAQFVVALAIAWVINPISFIFILLGMLGYVGVYSLWLKRTSAWNIILGGFSGGMPVLFGWAAVTGRVDVLPVLVAMLVVFWIPNHIWNLSIFFKEDYKRVGVPMLPVVYNVKKTLLFLFVSVLGMFVLSLGIYFHCQHFGNIYLITAIASGVILLAGNLYLLFNTSEKKAWFLYKLSSPYLFVLFLAMIIDFHLG